MSKLSRSFKKIDAYGTELTPGDVVAYKKSYLVYKGPAPGGSKSVGAFGVFMWGSENISLLYTSVVFVYNPMSNKRPVIGGALRTAIERLYKGIDVKE